MQEIIGDASEDCFKKVFCTVEVSKNDQFEVEEFWIVRKIILDFVEPIACPMMLNPSFPPRSLKTFRLMFETFKEAVDIIEKFFHTDERLKDQYLININFEDVIKDEK